MVDVPFVRPATRPEASTIATDELLLIQVPPVGVLFSVVLLPWQTWNVPVIAAGVVFTVTIFVVKQPPGIV